MSVYRPARSPYYHYDFVFKGDRHCGSTLCASKTEARAFEAAEKRRIATGDKTKAGITLSEGFGLWSAEAGCHHANWPTEKGQIKTLLRLLGGARPMSDFDIGDFRRYVARRRAHVTARKAPLAPASINREIELARRVWRYLDKEYQVAPIQWGDVLLAEPDERVRELLPSEERRLFAELDDDLAAVAEFAMLSGQRRTSVITLLWKQVDFEGARATVRVKGGGWHSVPLTPRMVALIANRPQVGPFVFTYVCKRPSPARKDRPRRLKGDRYPFSKQGWARTWRKALADAKIDDFRFHDLRHTAGTRGLRATGNLKAVQKQLGHTDIATTARYAHALEDDVRQMMIAAESRIIPEPAIGGVVEIRRISKDRA